MWAKHEMLLLTGIGIFYFVVISNADCPDNLPIEIEGRCYGFQTQIRRFDDARDNCVHQDSGATITSIKSAAVLQKLEELIEKYILSKMEKALFWIGLKLDDKSLSKAAEDRDWSWDLDGSKIVQKDYTLWDTEGGPKDKGLTCSALNVSDNFLVKAVDCGGPRLPVVCMMQPGETCKHDIAPYLMYGDYCIASLSGALEYNKIHGACSPHKPTPYKEEMREFVMMAVKNSFLGGGLYMNMKRLGNNFYDLDDGSVPDADMWEEGEPRDEYDCVVLSMQPDNSLRLKTINCEFMAASLCVIGASEAVSGEETD